MMSCIDPLLIITAREKYQRQQRFIHQVANGIAVRLHINGYGRELLPLIGKDDDLNNADAMRSWVAQELKSSPTYPAAQLSEQLTGRFVSMMVELGYYPS